MERPLRGQRFLIRRQQLIGRQFQTGRHQRIDLNADIGDAQSAGTQKPSRFNRLTKWPPMNPPAPHTSAFCMPNPSGDPAARL